MAEPVLAPYNAADAGALVLAVSASADHPNYVHHVCIRNTDGLGYRDIVYNVFGFRDFGQPGNTKGEFAEPPFDSAAGPPLSEGSHYSSSPVHGVVKVIHLKPGRYALYWIDPMNGCGSPGGRLGLELHVPFEVKPSAAVYLGDIRNIEVFRSGHFIGEPTRFIVTRRLYPDRDIPLARAEEPGLVDVTTPTEP